MSDTHQPVAALIAGWRALLAVSTVTTLAPGGVHNDLPQSGPFPAIRLWARAKPVGAIASDAVWEADVEIWIYSEYSGDKEALAIAEVVVGLVNPTALTAVLDGWTAIVTGLEDVAEMANEEIAGKRVRAWVVAYHLSLERAA